MPSAPSSDEMYQEILRERAAWKRAKRAVIEATLREAGELVVGCGGGCGCAGCDEAPAAKAPPARTRREASNEDPRMALAAQEMQPCFQTPFHFQLPEFHEIDLATQLCFAMESGTFEWPRTACCPPLLRTTASCEPPSMGEYISAAFQVEEHPLDVSRDQVAEYIAPATNIALGDRQLFGSAISILMKNKDIALWATCLVQSWSKDLKGYKISDALLRMFTLSNNRYPFTITYVESDNEGTGMFAFSINKILKDMMSDLDPTRYTPGLINDGQIGIVITINNEGWKAMVENWEKGGASALCASSKAASSILHELIHALGDHYDSGVLDNYDNLLVEMGFEHSTGTLHDDNQEPPPQMACWDEARMISSIFKWSIAKRYPCIKNTDCCSNFDNNIFFAYSKNSQTQTNITCVES